MRSYEQIPLVRLALSSGWEVKHHQLVEVEPTDADDIVHPQVDVWELFFSQDLFWAVHDGNARLIDVGWYPDADRNGRYRLIVAELRRAITRSGKPGYGAGRELERKETRSLKELVDAINAAAVTYDSDKS